jgi:hypothetical protein
LLLTLQLPVVSAIVRHGNYPMGANRKPAKEQMLRSCFAEDRAFEQQYTACELAHLFA